MRGGDLTAGLSEVAAIRAALSQRDPHRGLLPHRASAVLLPLFASADGACLLFTLRSEKLSSHAGQVSFPGGRIDPGEAPRDAALREADEEVGIAPGAVDVLGHLFDYVTFRDQLVCAYVGLVRGAPPTTPRSHDEVAEVFTVALDDFLDPAKYESRTFGGFREGREEFGTKDADERQRIDDSLVHYFHVKPHAVWGVTGRILAEFLSRAYDWRPTGKPRVIDSMEEFLP